MNNLVCTLGEQVNLAEEIELTDSQLETIFGGHDHCHNANGNSVSSSNAAKPRAKKHFEFVKTIHEHFEFSFDLVIKEFIGDDDDDDDADVDGLWKDCGC